MQFEFYSLEAGREASIQLCEIQSARLEAPHESAKATVNRRFRELVSSNPDIGNVAVVSTTIGDPPGTILATEYVDAQPGTGRRLAWVVDPSTGLK